MARTTRDRLIEAASQRFYRDGFKGVGIDQILSDVGISKTAFYKHFESKDDLVLEVLRQQDAWLRERFEKELAARPSATACEQLFALFDVVARIVEADEYRGCFFVNVVMEFPLPHDPAHRAAADNKRGIHEMVLDIASRTGTAEPERLAEQLCLIMEGAYVTRQVTGTARAAQIARELARLVIAAHVPGNRGR